MKAITREEKNIIRDLCQGALVALINTEESEKTMESMEDLHEKEHGYIVALEELVADEVWSDEEDDGTITIRKDEYEELIAIKTKFELARKRAAESGYRDAVDRILYDLAESPECDHCDGDRECGKTICPNL